MKEQGLTSDREVLEQYFHDYSVCGKCKICQACHVQEVDDERFWRNCPSGTRFRYEAYYAAGKLELANALVRLEMQPTDVAVHALYTCMLCGSCEEQCYGVKQLFPLKVIELLRERAVRDGWGPPAGFDSLKENMAGAGRLLGDRSKENWKWAEELGVAGALAADNILFVGCSYAARPELEDDIRSLATVLKEAGVEFSTMEEEPCCGAPLQETGERDLFERMALENVARIKASGATRVITACPHCVYIFKEEYGDILDEVEFVHASEFVARLIADGTITPKKLPLGKVAYHDPCMLGRRLEIYDEPRSVVQALSEEELVELPRNRNNSLCCGGGGMAWWAYPELASWVACERLFEADWAGAERVVTACPQCQWVLGKEAGSCSNAVKVQGTWSLLARSLAGGEEV